jgi:hypothetical protein
MQQPPNDPDWQGQQPNTHYQPWQPQDYSQPTQQHPTPQQPFSQPQWNQQHPQGPKPPGQFQPPPPLPHTRFMAWLRRPSRSRILVLGFLLPLCIIMCCVATGISALSGSQHHSQTAVQATATDTPTSAPALIATDTPTATPVPTATPTPVPTATDTPSPTPTPTVSPAQVEELYKGLTKNTTVDNLDKDGNADKGKDVHFTCKILKFVKDDSGNTAGANVESPDSDSSSVIQIAFPSGTDITKLNEGDILEVWGTDGGVFSGQNAFGGDVQEVGVGALYMTDTTTGYQTS